MLRRNPGSRGGGGGDGEGKQKRERLTLLVGCFLPLVARHPLHRGVGPAVARGANAVPQVGQAGEGEGERALKAWAKQQRRAKAAGERRPATERPAEVSLPSC